MKRQDKYYSSPSHFLNLIIVVCDLSPVFRFTHTLATYTSASNRFRQASTAHHQIYTPCERTTFDMRVITQVLLLAAFTVLTLATPVPLSDEEVQRRWSKGESEVCCSPNLPGCYVLEWVRSLAGDWVYSSVRFPPAALLIHYRS